MAARDGVDTRDAALFDDRHRAGLIEHHVDIEWRRLARIALTDATVHVRHRHARGWRGDRPARVVAYRGTEPRSGTSPAESARALRRAAWALSACRENAAPADV
jgi:hypothetical protein